MYQSETEPEAKKAVLQSLGVAGDSDRLAEVAATDKDPELRLAALRLLGPFGGPPRARRSSGSTRRRAIPGVKEAALSALFVSNNASRSSTSRRARRTRSSRRRRSPHLANMHSKEATAFLLEILNK